MEDASQIKTDMEVTGSDGQHLGVVDCLKDGYIILTRHDPTAQGKHHAIPLSWVSRVEPYEVRLNQTAAKARQNWIDIEKTHQQTASKTVCP
jgi:hypothetical protein